MQQLTSSAAVLPCTHIPRPSGQGTFSIYAHSIPPFHKMVKWVRSSARFSPLGLGVRQTDSQTLCLPQTEVWESLSSSGDFSHPTAPDFKVASKWAENWGDSGCPPPVGLLPYLFRKTPQTARYAFKSGSQGHS